MIYKIITAILLLLSTSFIYAQKPVTAKLTPGNPSLLNDTVPPMYEGGVEELYKFLEANIKYPPILIKIKMEGELDLTFTVSKDGDIKKVEILSGFDPDADDEVLRVIHAMPKWTPASVKGKDVDFAQRLTVTFTLTDSLIELAENQPEEQPKDSLSAVVPKDSLPPVEEPVIITPILDSLNTDPQFPGGKEALEAYLKANMKYPKRAIEHRIEGRVIFNIEVSAEGEITKVWIYKGVFPDCDEEAYYLIRKMPKWIPGLKDGKPAAKQIVLPIPFVLPR
ncbi:TonB family protein [Dysgonomonas sp. 521]|uniref:energy transducer TonB n=1 Tax=Dysgonomonas sp. 521 TaxID=2302932 RepID=UPI0013D5CD1E|nr:energy transducer TonB [Dysgonomonas sp. 521]NDV96655.1 TonB family protein [Dysgonomonas sp. 521]